MAFRAFSSVTVRSTATGFSQFDPASQSLSIGEGEGPSRIEEITNSTKKPFVEVANFQNLIEPVPKVGSTRHSIYEFWERFFALPKILDSILVFAIKVRNLRTGSNRAVIDFGMNSRLVLKIG